MNRSTDLAIRQIDVFGYQLSYRHGDYTMSGGRVVNVLDSTVVRLSTEAGIQGFGEVCPLGPTYLESHSEGARAALAQIAPHLIGRDAGQLSLIADTMDTALRGHRYAKSAIDVACWDILGKAANRPVCDLLGGREQQAFALYVAVPFGPPAEMSAFVQMMRDEGVRHFQLKLGGSPEDDAGRAAAVVQLTEEGDHVIADANGGWQLQDAVLAVRLLEELPRLHLEQPCASLDECIQVRHRTSLPMILDEAIADISSLLLGWRHQAMEAINLKVGKVGGLTRSRLMRDLAQELGLGLTIEDTWGGDIVSAACAHLAASTRSANLFTVSFMNDWVREHIAYYQPRSHEGMGEAPTGPGLGIEVDAEYLGEPIFSYP